MAEKDNSIVAEVLAEYFKSTAKNNDNRSKEIETVVTMLAQAISEIRNRLDEKLDEVDAEVKQKLDTVQDGYTPVKGVDYFDGKDGHKGDDGKDGISPDPQEVVSLVLEQIPKGETADELYSKLPQYGTLVRDALELLDGEERLDIKYIKGWEEMLKRIKSVESRPAVIGGMGGRDLIQEIDLSPQLDGVTTTFNIQAVYKILTVDLSSFPNALRKGVDYTNTTTTITFTSQIDPATSLAAGQTCIITAVRP